MSGNFKHNVLGSHLKDTQGGEILPRWFSPRVIEQIDSGNDYGKITAKFATRELSDWLVVSNHILSVALK